jgi:hypothetical protein
MYDCYRPLGEGTSVFGRRFDDTGRISLTSRPPCHRSAEEDYSYYRALDLINNQQPKKLPAVASGQSIAIPSTK